MPQSTPGSVHPTFIRVSGKRMHRIYQHASGSRRYLAHLWQPRLSFAPPMPRLCTASSHHGIARPTSSCAVSYRNLLWPNSFCMPQAANRRDRSYLGVANAASFTLPLTSPLPSLSCFEQSATKKRLSDVHLAKHIKVQNHGRYAFLSRKYYTMSSTLSQQAYLSFKKSPVLPPMV